MAWAKNGTPHTLTGTASTNEITDLTATKFNQFMSHQIASGAIDSYMRFNSDSTSVYSGRYNDNGASDGTVTSQTYWIAYHGEESNSRFAVSYVCSISGEEKLGMVFVVEPNAAGAGNTPDRKEWVGKYIPSPDANITAVSNTEGASGSYAIDTNLSALGSDLTPAAAVPAIDDVQNNSLFVEKDTARRYWRTPPTSDYTQYGWAVDSSTRIQTLGASASLPSTGTFTWSFWYKPNSISAEHYLFNKLGSSSGEYSPRLYLQTTGALKATSTTNGVGYGGNAITSNVMTIGSWNHVICKQTGNTIYAILNNGTAASASVISGNNSGEDYQFFLDNTGVDGDIKNAILYSTALSASDITALYNSGTPTTSSTAGVTSNILIEHIFDSDTSTTSAANTGSLGGSASVIAGTASVVGTPATWTLEFAITRGLFMGSYSPTYNNIQYITIATTGNTTDFGDLTVARGIGGGVSSDKRSCMGGGFTGSNLNVIDYVTTLTTGNAVDFGDRTITARGGDGCDDLSRGIFFGGYSTSIDPTIDYITMDTTGNATDFGDQAVAHRNNACVADATRGVCAGGVDSGGASNIIDYVTIQTTGNSTDFGNLTVAGDAMSGAVASETRAVFGVRQFQNVLDYVTILTAGNATDFGDLVTDTFAAGATYDLSRGVWAGGDSDQTRMNYITIETTGNGADFGDLSTSGQYSAGGRG